MLFVISANGGGGEVSPRATSLDPLPALTAAAAVCGVQAIIIQPCPVMMPTHSADAVTASAGGGIVTEGLPGSTVYAGGSTVSSSSSTVDAAAAPDSAQLSAAATSAISIPPPIAILAPVDQRSAVGGGGVPQGEGNGSTAGAAQAAAAMSSRPQQAVCQLVQPSPQAVMQETGSLQGVISPAGTQMISTDAAAAVQSQVRSYHRQTFVCLSVCLFVDVIPPPDSVGQGIMFSAVQSRSFVLPFIRSSR